MVEYRGEIASRPQNRPTVSPINVANQPLATKSPVGPTGRVSAARRVPKRVNRGLTGGQDGRRDFRPRPWVGSRSSPLEAVVERLLEHARSERAILQRHGGERRRSRRWARSLSRGAIGRAGVSPANAILIVLAFGSRRTEGNRRRSVRNVSIRLPGTTCAWVSMIIDVLRLERRLDRSRRVAARRVS